MPPQKGLVNITKIVLLVLALFIVVLGGAAFYFTNVPASDISQKGDVKKPTIVPLPDVMQRDFQRMLDVKQLQAVLKTYHDTCNGYPPMPRIAVFGTPLLDGKFNVGCPKGVSFGTISATVIGKIPVNPGPGGMNYTYCSEGVLGSGKCGISTKGKAEGYLVTFKLEGAVDTFTAGVHTATPAGIK